ncbi:MAG TPA: hypothetical protein VH475_09200 [Tepidisphaeraceae bacterium]|jgi:hypothetical protein
MLFFKTACRSIVLGRAQSHHSNPPQGPAEETILEPRLVEAARQARKSDKLSAFEKELLRAWSED